MSDPSLELQRAIYTKLTGSAALATAMGGSVRAYDNVPPDHVFPYLTISDAQIIDDSDTCEADRVEIFTDVHVWSRTVGMAEAKAIAWQVRTDILALGSVADWTASIIDAQQIRHMRDPDGLTTHSMVTFRFILEPQ